METLRLKKEPIQPRPIKVNLVLEPVRVVDDLVEGELGAFDEY